MASAPRRSLRIAARSTPQPSTAPTMSNRRRVREVIDLRNSSPPPPQQLPPLPPRDFTFTKLTPEDPPTGFQSDVEASTTIKPVSPNNESQTNTGVVTPAVIDRIRTEAQPTHHRPSPTDTTNTDIQASTSGQTLITNMFPTTSPPSYSWPTRNDRPQQHRPGILDPGNVAPGHLPGVRGTTYPTAHATMNQHQETEAVIRHRAAVDSFVTYLKTWRAEVPYMVDLAMDIGSYIINKQVEVTQDHLMASQYSGIISRIELLSGNRDIIPDYLRGIEDARLRTMSPPRPIVRPSAPSILEPQTSALHLSHGSRVARSDPNSIWFQLDEVSPRLPSPPTGPTAPNRTSDDSVQTQLMRYAPITRPEEHDVGLLVPRPPVQPTSPPRRPIRVPNPVRRGQHRQPDDGARPVAGATAPPGQLVAQSQPVSLSPSAPDGRGDSAPAAIPSSAGAIPLLLEGEPDEAGGRTSSTASEGAPAAADASTDTQTPHTTGPAAPPPQACDICCEIPEPDDKLFAPCRCGTKYCKICVREMFTRAITLPESMPPKCCTMLHLHLGFELLDTQTWQTFQDKFEEWMSTDRIYCPVPSCSAFIPDRLRSPPSTTTLMIGDVINKRLPELTSAIAAKTPSNVLTSRPEPHGDEPRPTLSEFLNQLQDFKTFPRFMSELDRFCRHCSTIHRHHAQAIRDIVYKYVEKAQVALTAAQAAGLTTPTLIACPDCSIAVCMTCKQKAHPGKPCDTTQQDYEMAMLLQYRYKRCPNCKTAVKKMFGCSHMQCLCGCHWCWSCGLSFRECMGQCGDDEDDDSDGGDDDDEEDMEDDEDDDDEVMADAIAESIAHANAVNRAAGQTDGQTGANAAIAPADPVPREAAADTTAAAPPMTGINDLTDTANINAMSAVAPPTSAPAHQTLPPATGYPAPGGPPRDLDGGGARRWGDGGAFFGEEPNDPGDSVLDCHHRLKPVYADAEHKIITKDTKLICGGCFKHMPPLIKSKEPEKPTPAPPLPVATRQRPTERSMHAAQVLRGGDSVKKEPEEKPRVKDKPRRDSATVPYICDGCNICYCGTCRDTAHRLGKAT